MIPAVRELEKVCSFLNARAVQYLAIGGLAVAAHGYTRMSMNESGQILEKPDLDFWYNPTYDNYFRLIDVLEDLGKEVKIFRDEQTPDPLHSFFRYQFPHFTLDFLPSIKLQLKFREAYDRKFELDVGGFILPVISYDDLLKDKIAASRPKDISDIEALKRFPRIDGDL